MTGFIATGTRDMKRELLSAISTPRKRDYLNDVEGTDTRTVVFREC